MIPGVHWVQIQNFHGIMKGLGPCSRSSDVQQFECVQCDQSAQWPYPETLEAAKIHGARHGNMQRDGGGSNSKSE